MDFEKIKKLWEDCEGADFYCIYLFSDGLYLNLA